MNSFIVCAAHNDNVPSNFRLRAKTFRSIFGMLNTSWQWGTSSSNVFTTQLPHRITRTWWQLGQKYRTLQEKATVRDYTIKGQPETTFQNYPFFPPTLFTGIRYYS